MKVPQFISTLTDLDPDYILVPENVDLSEVEIALIPRSEGGGYVYPDGVYYNRDYSRFEELVTVSSRYMA